MKNLSDLCSDYKNTSGVYREPIEFILRLAEFYLFVNEERLDKLKSFEHFPCKEASSFLFAIAVGGDGAPGIGMSVLISFINVGERIASSAEQFLLFGADVDENSDIVTIFFEKLVGDLNILENSVFDVMVKGTKRKVEFKPSQKNKLSLNREKPRFPVF